MRSALLGLAFWGSFVFGEMCGQLPGQLAFKGEFGPVSATHLECERLFAVTEYETDHFRAGPTGRTSVLHFHSSLPGAFLNRVSLVGLLVPDCDINADKKIEVGGTQYLIHSEGLVGIDFLLASVTVRVQRHGTEVCRG